MGGVAPEALKGEDWAGEMGARWLASLDRFEGMIAPIGAALLERAAYQPGERVLDLGCGGGATTLAIAAMVGPEGAALGLDIAPMLIEQAEARAAAAGRCKGTECQSSAVKGRKRCRMHGRTSRGALKCNRNAWKYSARSGQAASTARLLIVMARHID